MFSAKIKELLAPHSRISASSSIHFLDQSSFSRSVETQLQRTSRTGEPFSVVIFDVSESASRRLRDLLVNMSDERRCTDTLGWFAKDKPAVLLYGTHEEGAKCYRERIFASFESPLHSEIRCFGGSRPTLETVEDDATGTNAGSAAEVELSEVGLTALSLAAGPRPIWKAVLDCLLALVLLLFTAPVFLATAVIVKLGSPGPVFFKQKRVGLGGRPFTIWKFRTMRVESSASHSAHVKLLIRGGGTLKKADDSLPLVPFGKLLRASCIDELPQLFNVLLGQMSLVGPRPCMLYEAEELQVWQRERFLSTPGITGLWQVSGKNLTTFDQMIRFDINYGRRISLGGDMVILFRTIPVVLKGLQAALSWRSVNLAGSKYEEAAK